MNDEGRWNATPASPGAPDFQNLLAVLDKREPARPTLFEFFLNEPLYQRLAPHSPDIGDAVSNARLRVVHAFRAAGYDFATVGLPGFEFTAGEVQQKETRSINDGAVISDRETFDRYRWPDLEATDFDLLDRMAPHVPDGMKLIAHGPCGILENAIFLTGYESLCFMIMDDPELAADLFERIGSLLVRYYERAVEYDCVGAVIGNDDWGYKSQTMLSPEDMRRFVFPCHKKIVEVAHAAGKPAILHSCGCLTSVMDNIIDDMKYDGKHSYEDNIQPVEEAYEQYGSRIAILGGIDVDFVCRSDPADVFARSTAMLERAADRGSYALGTGNSVPEYVPDAGYFAMIDAALSSR